MTTLDWSILLTYLAVVLLIGRKAIAKKQNIKEYFLAGKSIGVFAVVASIIATETSAATFIGGPDTSYNNNLCYLQTTIGAVCSRFFLAYLVIGVYYEHKVYTVYQFLGKRFNSLVQKTCAALFCFGRLLASGARLYIAAFAVAVIIATEAEIYQMICLISVIAIIYAVLGGLRAVIWTDIVQGILFLVAGLYSLYFVVDSLGGINTTWKIIKDSEKLLLFDFNFNLLSLEFWANPYTFIGAVVGGFTLGLATHGTDQDMVQRMLTCRDSKDAKRSLIIAGLVEIPVALLFVGLGLVLWAYYQQMTGVSLPATSNSVFPHFIATALPQGIRGLVVAGIFAAAMSSLDSALTALSSVSVNDFSNNESTSSTILVKKSKLYSLIWGMMLCACASGLAAYHRILLAEVGNDAMRQTEFLSLALGVMALLYGPLLGVFIIAIFSKRGSTKSVVCGLALGVISMVLLKLSQVPLGWTWYTLAGCLISVLVASLGRTEDFNE